MPEPVKSKYTYSKDNNNRGFLKKDDILLLLSKCFNQTNFSYKDALELALEYTIKKPECYQQLQDAIIENFNIDIDDLASKCDRQQRLFYFLIEKLGEGALFEQALFNTLPTLLRKSFSTHRHDNINLLKKPLHIATGIETVKDLRISIWRFIIDNYKNYKEKVDDYLRSYIDEFREGVKAVYELDFPFLDSLFRKHFKKTSISDVFIIQDILYRLKRLGIKAKEREILVTRFLSSDYQIYLLLRHDRLRDKEEYDFDNYNEFELLKEAEIRKSFMFKSLPEFRKFYLLYQEISLIKDRGNDRISISLDIILHEHALHSISFTFQMLQEIIKSGNPTTFYPRMLLEILFEDQNKDLSVKYYHLIKTSDFSSKDFWVWYFYYFLPQYRVDTEYTLDILAFLATSATSVCIEFSVFQKFIHINNNIYTDALSRIVANKQSRAKNIYIDHYFFDKYIGYYQKRLDLLRAVYIILKAERDHFDHNCMIFLSIVRLDNTFFLDYIKLIAKDSMSFQLREFDHLSIIWQLDDANVIIEAALDHLLSLNGHYVSRDLCMSLFKNIIAEQHLMVIEFLKEYLKKRVTDSKTVNLVFYCIRNAFPRYWHEFLLYYLSINSDFEAFKELQLLNDHFSSNGDVIWSDVKAAQLQSVLDLIETLIVKKYRYNKHKNHLKVWINNEKRFADHERKLKFQNRDWH